MRLADRQSGVRFAERAQVDRAVNQLARTRLALEAQGVTVTDLTDTNPTRHLAPDTPIFEAVAGQVAIDRRYQPDPHGPMAARQALAQRYGGEPKDYFLTSSTSQAYGWLFTLLANPGELVATPTPGYPLIEPIARLAGLGTVGYPFHYLPTDGWVLDTERLSQALRHADTAALVLVNPGNPTGTYLDDAARRQVLELAASGGVAVIEDRVFGPFQWAPELPPNWPWSTAKVSAEPTATAGGAVSAEPTAKATTDATPPGLVFTVDGLSKLVGLPQLKLGWIRMSGTKELVATACRGLEMVADTFLPVNQAVATALPDVMERVPVVAGKIRQRVADHAAAASRLLGPAWRVRRANAGWVAVVDAPGLPRRGDLATRLLQEGHLAVHPGWLYDLPGERSLVVSLLPEPGRFAAGLLALAQAVERVYLPMT